MRIVIRPKDLEWEAFRAGGKGGQHQNKTSSAVRYRHLPTGITAESRDERDQHQNRKIALARVIDKLRAALVGDKEAKRREAYRDKPDASFGWQVRTYVLHGKDQRVVDHRTGVESLKPRAVLDGGIDEFIRANMIRMTKGE